VPLALHAVGITNDYEYHELHEFFIALFVQFGQFVHIRVFSCFKFVKLNSLYFEPCQKFPLEVVRYLRELGHDVLTAREAAQANRPLR